MSGLLHRLKPSVRKIATPGITLLACAVLSIVAIDRIAFLKYVDRFVGDWEIASLLPRAAQDPDVVIVAVTQETLQRFPYSAPVDRAFLSELLLTLAARSPRAIGLDILLTQPTESGKDEQLRRTMDEMKVPLVVGYADEEQIVNAQQREFLEAFVPERLRGLSSLSADQFDTVRWINDGHVTKYDGFVPSFDHALAAAAGATDLGENVEIVWHGHPALNVPPFRIYPAHVAGILPPAWFKDKIVLIGTVSDRHRTPFSTILQSGEGMLPAVEIHAHGVAQLLHRTYSPLLGMRINLLIAVVIAALGTMLGLVGWPLVMRVGSGALLLVAIWVGGAGLFHYFGAMPGVVAPTIAFVASFFAMEALSGREARRQREFITGAFSRFVSHKVVEALIRDPARLKLGGERRLLTFLFTDIANYVVMSEALDPTDLAHTLNEYFDGMLEIALNYDGTIGRFEGDATFLMFNAPVDQPDHAQRAVQCAIEIDRFATTYCTEQNARGIPFGVTRIGIHTGAAVVGNFGASKRFDYSAQGDAVNTAARLEGVNKQFGTHICISDATRALCNGIAFRPLGSVVVKGKSISIPIWEPVPEPSPYLARYREAYAALECDAPEALRLLAELNQENPEDRCVALHLDRLYRGEHGVEMVLTEK